MNPTQTTTPGAHGLRSGDVIIVDMRRCPRFMPMWFYRLVWRRFQREPKPVRVGKVTSMTFTFDEEDRT
jgi:hypothetical protein